MLINVCAVVPQRGLHAANLPASRVAYIDKPYSSDMHLAAAFRHEISVPDDLFPRLWLKADVKPMGDFNAEKLGPGQIAVIRWDDNKEAVTDHAYRLGLPSHVCKVLLEYCDKMGITELLKAVTLGGNTFEPGTEAYLDLQGFNWYLQRPSPEWRSNLHWLSPADNPLHEDYLQALNAAGFSEVFASIGKQLGMDGVVAFHVTFIAVSWSTQGYVHYDDVKTPTPRRTTLFCHLYWPTRPVQSLI